jgi:hypothetical protein
VSGQRWLVTLCLDGYVQMAVFDGYQRGVTAVHDGSWHHVAVVLPSDGSPNTSEVKIYVDGTEEGSYATVPMAIDTGSDRDVRIGLYDDPSARYFNGLIDDVRIYDVAISAAQVQQIVKPTGDFNHDGSVCIPDLSVFQSKWLD